ncbi:MAG: hypothetical protein ACI80I_002208 [Akkermansiaceae bacterium]|jgi:hypothetical protein
MPRLTKPRLKNGADFQNWHSPRMPRGPEKAALEKANVT